PMKNKFLLLTWLLAVPLLWAGCNWFGNDDDEITIKPIDWDAEETLPEMTTTGENTFGCLVNGEVWRPKGGPYFGLDAQLSFSYHEPTGGLFISASRRLGPNDNGYDTYQRIGINATFKGISPSDSVRQCMFADINRCSSWNGNPMILDSMHTNVIDITFLDTDQNIISGTFNFLFIKEDCHDTIRVTDGRFDIKYAN
ncbi:MAG: hypothetical protein ACE362_28675, partial [Phaeodactylibacter xiamenensis]|uniref:hypothetical protein n=2 Tax=Phaeodactylibacter xiamenensis TaxID=1524460 RepID=UPI00391BC0C4